MQTKNDGTICGLVRDIIREKIGTNGTDKATLIVSTASPGDKYPNDVPITAIGKSAGKFDGVGIGDEVEVKVWLRGREWKGRHFADIAVNECRVMSVAGPADPASDAPAEETDSAMPF